MTVPREFVFMDRAAIGLGGVFLHLRAELNFYRLFNEAIEHFSLEQVAARQAEALAEVGLDASPCRIRVWAADGEMTVVFRRRRCPAAAFALSPGRWE